MLETTQTKMGHETFDEKDVTISEPPPGKGMTILTIDNIQVLGLDPDDAQFYTSFPMGRRKKLNRKVFIYFFLLFI